MATFDDAALSKLTAKIDNKLAESQRESQRKTAAGETKNENGNKKRKQTSDHDAASSEPPSNKRSRNDQKKGRNVKEKKGNPPKSTTGGGHDDKAKAKANAKGNAKNSTTSDLEFLLNEIKALGGSEDDLKLVENVDSDEETGDLSAKENAPDEKLRAELAQFAAGLGFEKVAPEFVAAESESESESESEEPEDEPQEGEEIDDDSEDVPVDHDDHQQPEAGSSPSDLDDKSRSIFKGKTVSKILYLYTATVTTQPI